MKSKYIGVYWSESSKKWYSRIRHEGKQIYLGLYDTEEAAATAYDKKAYELRGDNSKFNFKLESHLCEAPNCSNLAITKFNEKWVYQKHKSQLLHNGDFLQRTMYEKNIIEIKDGKAFIHLYNKNDEKISEAIIDEHNVELIKQCKWYLRPDGYVATNSYNGKYTYLHLLICKKNNKSYADHIDRNKLNNMESNLREATGSENQMNKGIRSDNSSGKVGVHWSKQNNAWCAMICKEGIHINLGYFSDFNLAVKCRVNAEKTLFGEYRVKNENHLYGEGE